MSGRMDLERRIAAANERRVCAVEPAVRILTNCPPTGVSYRSLIPASTKLE
jgi:hypothetical protein